MSGQPNIRSASLAAICDGVIDREQLGDSAELLVNGLALDSRKVAKGDVFIALKGARVDAGALIDDALRAGASVVLLDADSAADCKQDKVLRIADLRRRVGLLASNFYQHPSQQLNVIGVTGTNGKTTIAYMIASLKRMLGENVGLIGTLGAGVLDAGVLDDGVVQDVSGDDIFSQLIDTQHTTPDALMLQQTLNAFVQRGCRSAVLEVSSHALDQGRANGIAFDVAVFSNLTRDHLDYHGNMASYAEAKQKLFAVSTLRAAVVNRDDEYAEAMVDNIGQQTRVLRYALNDSTADISAHNIASNAYGTTFELRCFGRTLTVSTRYLGEFNVSNLLAAISVLVADDYPLEDIVANIARLSAVPGRMEVVGLNDFTAPHSRVVIDFAHTPDALEKVLLELKKLCTGKLWCVFGCGGDRDQGKRPLMGAVAARHADVIVITADNPRSESVDSIIGDIVVGIDDKANITIHLEADRAAAIALAISRCGNQDVVLVAGKGHEKTQIFADKTEPFSDYHVAEQYLVARYCA